MIVPVAVQVRLSQARPMVAGLAERVRAILSRRLQSTGFAVIDRIKEPESLAEKLESGRFRRWSDVDDLFACAVIVPTLVEEAEVLSFLQKAFREVAVRRRGTGIKDPSTFRFDSTRFIGTLKPAAEPEPPDAMSQLRFEVQIRTAFEHAWVIASHRLAYKGGNVDWRRLRLLAQLKAASEQLDHLIAGFEGVSEQIPEESWPEVVAQRTIETRFRGWISEGRIPPECAPDSWVRFSRNVFALLVAVSGDRRRGIPELKLREALEVVERGIAKYSGDLFPKSISLLQFVVGVLAAEGVAKGTLVDYCPLVTDSLLSLFPATAALDAPFDFESL